jgi:branched-chain amino acid transport system substrate-binding protein
MQPRAGRDPVYAMTVALTVGAMCAFGAFLYRDYQDQGMVRADLATVHRSAGGGPASSDTLGGAVTPAGGGAGVTSPSLPGGAIAHAHAGGSALLGPGRVSQPAVVPASLAGGASPACVNGTIKIGQINAITGPLTMQTAANATAAYFKKVNSEGGINGCQVDFTYLDDGGLDQQKAAADARELVQQDNVFAVVGGFTPGTAVTTEPYFRKAGVPVVGVEGIALQEYDSPVEYSFAISPQGFGIATANMAHRLGKKRLAVFYIDGFDVSQVWVASLREQAARNGQQIVYSGAENIASATYGTDVVAARNANPDVVINLLDANSAVREINAMNSNNWFPDLVGTTSSADPVVIKQGAGWFSNPSHQVHVLRCYLPANANTAEVNEWLQTEGRYFPGFDPNAYAEGSWLAAKIFTDVARRLGAGLTRASLLAALNSLHEYQTGFTPDITMTADHGPNRQVLWMKWDGTQFSQVQPFGPW